MLKTNEFILLKALFNEQLHHAVMEKNAEEIQIILNNRYQYESQNGYIEEEPINVDLLQRKHQLAINDPKTIERLS